MIQLTISHIYGLLLILSGTALAYIILGGKSVPGKAAGLILWTGLLYSSFISQITFNVYPQGFAFNHQSAVLFAYGAFLIIPAMVYLRRYEIFPSYPVIGLFPFFIFFLIGFDHPLIWFVSYEILSLFLNVSRGTFHSKSYRIRYFLSSVILFLSLLMLAGISEQTLLRDYASLLFFTGLVLRICTPYRNNNQAVHAETYYSSFLLVALNVLLIIRVNPLMTSMPVRILGVLLFIVAFVTLIIETLQESSPALYLEMSIHSMFLPLLLFATSMSTHQYSLYLYLMLPFVFLFLMKETWTVRKHYRGYVLMLMTVHGLPLTAGSIIWIHFMSNFTFGSLYSYVVLVAVTTALSFWICLYKKIGNNIQSIDGQKNDHFDLLLLGILLYNFLLWSLLEKFPYFFGF